MANDLVGYSRAGDVFHYRWAARRCLRLVYPNTNLTSVIIEGSLEKEKDGEYVIDLSEYSELSDKKTVEYFQLKHTTTQKDKPFILSDLKDTFEGFGKRFTQHQVPKTDNEQAAEIAFSIVSNRKFDEVLKSNIEKIAKGIAPGKKFKNTLINYCGLQGTDLADFCAKLKLEDGEGDYNEQNYSLRTEMAQLTASSIDQPIVESLVALIRDKILPDGDNEIVKEDVLKRFGISSERDLYPAPSIWEPIEAVVAREQYAELKTMIETSTAPLIIHAEGGVGKSVFCRHFVQNVAVGSLAIAYDCFGAGTYRNRSTTRHRHKDGLIQISNELASKGLCTPLLDKSSSDEDIMKGFMNRVRDAITELKKSSAQAKLFILIDAADNAEMAAQELGSVCFAHEILKELFPDDTKLVLLCRTERIWMLQPPGKVIKIRLEPFSEPESLLNLRRLFGDASVNDGKEFHRLTTGNPRVQANALDSGQIGVVALLQTLGPTVTTVEEQIRQQLNSAVEKIKDELTANFQQSIDAICIGLASLPPHIPIVILAGAAKVEVDTVKSFVSDIGRSLWLSDSSIQFRDEPTETWFRETFTANKETFIKYSKILEPLAENYTYAAEALPQLYLQGGEFSKLIEIALSDDFLPKNNPLAARNVRIYRLQFAFKACLKSKNYGDATRIALLAGEEMAGDQRQLALLRSNIDLLVSLQGKEKVQELAYKRALKGNWYGSENIYSASLLSSFEDFKGEARGYLRSGFNWLLLEFEEAQNSTEDYRQDKVVDEDFVELSNAILNIRGIDGVCDFFERLNLPESVQKAVASLTKRLIDRGKYITINEILEKAANNVHVIVPAIDQMMSVGYIPELTLIMPGIKLLANENTRIEKLDTLYFDGYYISPAILSLLEAALSHQTEPHLILQVLDFYMPERAAIPVKSEFRSSERDVFLRALAIRLKLANKVSPNYSKILPVELQKSKLDYEQGNEKKIYQNFIGRLLPWYQLRLDAICNNLTNLKDEGISAASKYGTGHDLHDRFATIPRETASILIDILTFSKYADETVIKDFYAEHLENNQYFQVDIRLKATRNAFRQQHLSIIKDELERLTYAVIKDHNSEGPDEIATRYIDLARSVALISTDDASVYFDDAINIITKFGDEITDRWSAAVSLAKKSCETGLAEESLAFRFIRCAEAVGENLREKYWDRQQAIQVCSKMNPSVGIAALSRWRDRQIGRFDLMLETVICELVISKKIDTMVGWSLTKLIDVYDPIHVLNVHLESAAGDEIKKIIVDELVESFQKEGIESEYWFKLRETAHKFGVENKELSRYVRQPAPTNPKTNKNRKQKEATEGQVDWDGIFNGVNYSEPQEITDAHQRYWIIKNTYHNDAIDRFWQAAFQYIPEANIHQAIESFLAIEEYYVSDIRIFWPAIPESWKSKVGFKRKWSETIKKIGYRFAYQLLDRYYYLDITKYLSLSAEDLLLLDEAIFERLAGESDFEDAKSFFGFVSTGARHLSTSEATKLTEFAITRFELHIDGDFGDGQWRAELKAPDDIENSIAGFLWSALASPVTAFRWKAAHTIRAIAEHNHISIIDFIIQWMRTEKCGPFGFHEYPFYNLHGQLYFMIAMARVSIDYPEQLVAQSQVFLPTIKLGLKNQKKWVSSKAWSRRSILD